MKKHLRCLAVLLVPGLLLSGQKIRERDLAPQYQDWLKLVAYIIQPVEREVFMKLASDRDRDIFIGTFWKQRDPTPGTPENEYKDEIVKRFEYVNRMFGRSTTREGWRTDMGRIYMILGAPQSTERFEASIGLVPCQSWTYWGDTRRELPPQFILLFFQRGAVGEYKLYDPVSDGPARLLLDQKNIDPMDYEDLYEKLLDLQPTLAEAAITRIPGEYNFDFSPSPRNAILLADIMESPKHDVNTSYATHFLDYKGLVSTEYMTNFVESSSETALIRDPMTGLRFLHFAIAPANVSVDLYEPKNQYFCSYQLNVTLRKGEELIFQYTRDFPVYIPEQNVDRVRGNGLAIEDSFPVAEGTFRMTALLTNSVGKEFTVLEKEIVVPPDPGTPRLGGPYIGYRFETYQKEIHIPFKIMDKKLLVDPKNTFASGDDISIALNVENLTEELRQGGEVRLEVTGLRKEAPVHKSYVVNLAAYPFGRVLPITQTIPARDLEPDYYDLVTSLVAPGGRILDKSEGKFIVSAAAAVGHPIANAKGFALANQFLYIDMLAGQAEKLGRMDSARALYERAFNLNPEYKEGLLMYANFLLKAKDYDAALTLVERIRSDENRRFDYYVIRGKALAGKGLYADALVSLTEANKIYNSDVQVLNTLGLCYYRLGRKGEALEVLNASLKLNPAQADIKALVEEINK